jgi:hypothetical protein
MKVVHGASTLVNRKICNSPSREINNTACQKKDTSTIGGAEVINRNYAPCGVAHWYTKSFARRFQIDLRGGWAGCSPWLFMAEQPVQQPN